MKKLSIKEQNLVSFINIKEPILDVYTTSIKSICDPSSACGRTINASNKKITTFIF